MKAYRSADAPETNCKRRTSRTGLSALARCRSSRSMSRCVWPEGLPSSLLSPKNSGRPKEPLTGSATTTLASVPPTSMPSTPSWAISFSTAAADLRRLIGDSGRTPENATDSKSAAERSTPCSRAWRAGSMAPAASVARSTETLANGESAASPESAAYARRGSRR